MSKNEESGEESFVKYILALFEAGKAFKEEIKNYEIEMNKNKKHPPSPTNKFLDDVFLKKLPLEYRMLLKLPWKYVVDMGAEFVKGIADGPAEDVIKNLVGKYLESQR